MRSPLVAALCLCSGILISGCKVGPKYTTPSTQVPPAFKETADWKQAEPKDSSPRGPWWELFGDPQLNALEAQVNISNQDIAAAEARFRAARDAVRVADADLFPTVTVGVASTTARVGTNRSTVSGGFSTGSGTIYQLPLDLSYEADAWGRIRNNIQATAATAQATAADAETIRLSVHSELALDYLQLRGLDQELSILKASIASYEQALQLTTNRYNQGVVSQVDVSQAQTQLDTTRAQAIELGVARAQFEHAIAVLTGKPPAELTIALDSARIQQPTFPVGLPSQLLERRPDIAAAERRVAAANAQIGVAKAAYFPTISFNLSSGFVTSTLGTLLSWPSRFWSLGPSIAQTAFDAGRRKAITRQAQANYDTTVAVYRQSVLTAFQDVEDNLAALRILAEEAAQQDLAIASAQRSVDLANNRYRGGVTIYLEVITAQNALLANQTIGVGIHTRRMTATVLLIKALGGGW